MTDIKKDSFWLGLVFFFVWSDQHYLLVQMHSKESLQIIKIFHSAISLWYKGRHDIVQCHFHCPGMNTVINFLQVEQ